MVKMHDVEGNIIEADEEIVKMIHYCDSALVCNALHKGCPYLHLCDEFESKYNTVPMGFKEVKKC